MKRRRKFFGLVAGLVLVVAIGAFALGRPKDQAIEAKLERVSYGHFVTRLPETGVVQRPQTETLSAQVSGAIAAVRVNPGDRVAAGQILVRLANPQLVSNAAGARAAYEAAAGRASSAYETNAVLPAQNQSSVVQAEFNLEQAKFNLNQAITDQKNGAQSGLGYGGTTAQSQRVAADANVAGAQTSLSEAQRIYDADKDLYANKAISKDALSQQAARLAQAKIAADQARRQRADTYAQLDQNVSVLADRARATRDAVRQAEASLRAAKLEAAQSKAGDVTAARGDAAARLNDLRYAGDQVARLVICAPYAGIVQTIATQTADSLRPLQPGDSVSAGQGIVTIAADAGFIVRARVDEQDISGVRLGESARISGEDLGGNTLGGHITAIGEVAQKSDDPANTSRQIITTIKLDGSLPYLRDGMNVDVDIVTADRPHVIAIGSEAIRGDAAKPYVYVVRPGDGRAVRTPVALGASNDTQTIVTSGLRPGDTVVVDRNPAIVDNIAVKAAPLPTPLPSPGGKAA
jgi:multidrug efflux pump subunit AcrA (membrane-fusion protein)